MPIFAPIGSGSTSGSSGINYILNPDAESDVSGWAAYADAAAATPVDGTGGSPTVTITRTTTTPLRGTGSFLLTKDAANRQGQGVSYAFTIASADKAKVLNVSFEYEVPSGTFVAGDSSDLRIWVYDVTNSTLISVSPYTIQGNGTLSNKFAGIFQTASNSTSYRLIIHCATTSASAYTFEFDNVIVGPQVQLYGAPINDWNNNLIFTPSSSAFGTTTGGSYYTRRVGDSLEVVGSFVCGTVGAADAKVALPSGYSIDTTKLNTTQRAIIGWIESADDATASSFGNRDGVVTVVNSDVSNIYLTTAFDSSNFRLDQGSSIYNNSDTVMFRAVIPILGWGSTVVMSNDTDTRVVALKRTNTAGTAITTGDNVIPFATASIDTHSSWSTDTYTVPVAGTYRISASLLTASTVWAAVGVSFLYVQKNGSNNTLIGTMTIPEPDTYQAGVGGSTIINFNVGDTIKLNFSIHTGFSLSTSAGANQLSIERLSGPSVIAATETVAASYTQGAGQSISNSTTTVIDFETKVYDTHGAVTTGASWRFTAPISGKYHVSTRTSSAAGGGWDAGEFWSTRIRVNSSTLKTLRQVMQGSHAQAVGIGGSATVSMLAGDFIDIIVVQSSGGSLSTAGSVDETYVTIDRVGN